ncbi:hypothetical protein ACRAWF_01480 [Streptomyces sp. L7]
MADEQRHLHAAGVEDPFWRLWSEPWTRVVIGDDVEDWDRITENGDRRIDLRGLPDPLRSELAWMLHLAGDGRDPLRGPGHQAVREHPPPGDPR